MKQELRCEKCHQLQYKHEVKDNKLVIEVKCYNCNNFTYLTFDLNELTQHENNK
jgi:phage FluMu protein Com